MDREEIFKGIEDMQVFEKTLAKLDKAGLIIPDKPADSALTVSIYKEWDTMKQRYGGISNIPYNELGDFLDKWTALISYTRWVESVSDIEQQSALEIRDTIRKQLYTLQAGGREIRDSMVSIEPTYIKMEQDYNEKVSLYKAIKGLREGYETRANAISREISRRSAEVVDSRRGYNRGSGV